MNSCRSRGAVVPGNGPRGFAADVTPLPLATSRVFPSAVTRTQVGNQPTGMKPSEVARPTWETSNTATLLLFAFATKSVLPSGANPTLLGVEPGGEFGNSEDVSLSLSLPLVVSITLT